MTEDIKVYSVFIASPSGLEEIRECFREVLREYSEFHSKYDQISFKPVGWEDITKGAGRPQELIDEELRKCDFFVLALWDRWGTPPGDVEGQYSSGTQEEYAIAQDCLNDPKLNMKNLYVLFKGVDPRQMADPGIELTKVLDFRKTIEDEKSLFYDTFDSRELFADKIRRQLAKWRHEIVSDKTGSTTEAETLSNPIASASSLDIDVGSADQSDLIQEAQHYLDEGKLVQAEIAFSRAIVRGDDPSAPLYFAKYLMDQWRLDQAAALIDESMRKAEQLDQQDQLAEGFFLLGAISLKQGHLDEAEEFYKESLDIDEELGIRSGVAAIFHQLGMIKQVRGYLDEAGEFYKKSLDIQQELGNRRGMASSFHQLGMIEEVRGHLDEAEEFYKKSLDIEEELGNRSGMASSYHQLGMIEQDRGHLDEAEEFYRKSMEIHKELGRKPELATNFHQLGMIEQDRGHLEKAEEFYKKSLNIKEVLGDRVGSITSFGQLGLLAEEQNDLAEAAKYSQNALDISHELKLPVLEIHAHNQLTVLYEMMENAEEAAKHRAMAEKLEGEM